MTAPAAPPAGRPASATLAILAPFALVTLIWGSTWFVIRGQIALVPAPWSVTWRFLLAGAAMAVLALARREAFPRDPRGLAFAGLIGLTQFTLNFNFVYAAEAHITSGLVAVVFALLLVPNALFARVFLGQRLGRQLTLGSIAAMAGVALLFVHEARVDSHGPGRVLTGIGFTLCAVLAASSANVLQATKLARRYPMYSTLAVAMLAGAAIDALYAWATVGPPVFEARIGYAAGILYLGLAASAIAFPLYFNVIRVIGPAKAAYSSVIVPVIAMLLSTLFEGYRWSALAVGGAMLTGAGLIVALTARRPAR